MTCKRDGAYESENRATRKMKMQWSCVCCDASGEAEYTLESTVEQLLCAIMFTHETQKPNCPEIYEGLPAISIWESGETQKCERCGGSGTTGDGHFVRQCCECHGSGRL